MENFSDNFSIICSVTPLSDKSNTADGFLSKRNFFAWSISEIESKIFLLKKWIKNGLRDCQKDTPRNLKNELKNSSFWKNI